MLNFYKCRLIRIIDSDTIEVLIDVGFHSRYQAMIRMEDYDGPEIRTKDLEEKRLGRIATEKLRDILTRTETLYIKTHRQGSFKRWLGTIYLDEAMNFNVNQEMSTFVDELRNMKDGI